MKDDLKVTYNATINQIVRMKTAYLMFNCLVIVTVFGLGANLLWYNNGTPLTLSVF